MGGSNPNSEEFNKDFNPRSELKRGRNGRIQRKHNQEFLESVSLNLFVHFPLQNSYQWMNQVVSGLLQRNCT
ncbi:hypothetical protein, partial [Sphingobacterium bovisgrunnientis]|uniref:hypothetical protein n=1 Tax=Sphingobacterium bovisgrunnientis TaxID=1874697 RepID=UPI00195AAA61